MTAESRGDVAHATEGRATLTYAAGHEDLYGDSHIVWYGQAPGTSLMAKAI